MKEGNEDHQKGLLEQATKGHIEVVRLLLKYGAQADMRDKDGITASEHIHFCIYFCIHILRWIYINFSFLIIFNIFTLFVFLMY